MRCNIFLLITICSVVAGYVDIKLKNKYTALDESLYEEVLDPDLCHKQIRYIRRNAVLQLQFADAGYRTPRGVTRGNLLDMGNYHQCLGLTHETEEMSIQGKYCTMTVPLNQNFSLPWNSMIGFDPSFLDVDEEIIAKAKEARLQRAQLLAAAGIWNEEAFRSTPITELNIGFRVAVCIPKPCTTEQAITSFLFNVSKVGFKYEDGFCRLPNDKPWSPADTTATVLFSIIGLLTIISTGYDLISTKILKKDLKQANPLYTSFSVYTNGRRLMTFTSAPGTLHCLDAIRTLAMMWVVVGHSFSSENNIINLLDAWTGWLLSVKSLWIISATITVDTFICIAGILLAYTNAGKLTGVQLLKSLHLFYLNRLLRLLPILATCVLLQASLFNRIFDGPYWQTVENQTNYCRNHWWLTLLHVQNYIGVTKMCLPHSWYLAIDLHLYILSPLILFWMLGRNKTLAWTALVAGVLASIGAATVFNFIKNFPSGNVVFTRPDLMDYYYYYYFNTLTRASPFFVGMLGGYVLHVYRNKKVELPWYSAACLWIVAASVSTTIFFYPHFIVQPDWDNQTVDNIMNSFMRPAWAAAICWLVFACTHGFGGPVNWFLSLDIWKLPSRISYAAFIFHYPIMFVINSSLISPVYFSVASFFFKALANLTLALVVAYVITLLIDSPMSTLVKLLLGGNKKRPEGPRKEERTETQNSHANSNRTNGLNNEDVKL